jgi:PAS domain S-box-containing protein
VDKRPKILIVDDDQTSIDLVKNALKGDYNIITALNGYDAINQIKKQHPDLILLDVMMPDLDGFEVCKIIKSDDDVLDIPIIFLTVLASFDDELQGLELGGVDYITKPISLKLLKLRVRNQIALKERNELVKAQRNLLERQNEKLDQMLADQELQNKQLREAEEALRKSEETYRMLFSEMLDGFSLHEIICDSQGNPSDYRFLKVNLAFERITGLKSEDIIGRTALEVMPDIESHWIETYGNVALTGEPAHFENYAKALSKHFEVKAFRPAPNQVATIFVDITERKQADIYREMGREVLQILNDPGEFKDSIQHIITTLKTKTGFDAVGIRLQEGDDFPYFSENGFPADLLLKENSLLVHTEDGGLCRDECGNVCLECTCGLVIAGKSVSGQPFFTPGGSFWTNDSFPLLDLPSDVDPRLNPRNECIHHNFASVALIPIRLKEKIVGLIQFNDRLKGCFTLSSIELLEVIASQIGSALLRKQADEEKYVLEAQLHQAQKIESVGRLAGGVAHDFNNMLGVILGHAHLALMETDPTQPIHANLEEIRIATERSADLTRQLLAFARKQTVAPKVLDLNETISGMLKMLQRLIGEDINLNWQPSQDLWRVKVDPSQIDQILANLCVNARDSILDIGKISIETGNSTVDEHSTADNMDSAPGEYVTITVSDNGCGMENETMNHIFEPFFTTKEIGKGTGLGLATVYGAVRQNNGFIKVRSEPGIGTKFMIFLPRHACKSVHIQTEGVVKPAAPRGLETILLVEDEPAILNMASMILTKQGYIVLQANIPREAIRLARESNNEVHLLITDVVMPDMNGRDLAKSLQSQHPNLKCIFMSGYTADVIAHHGVLDDDLHFIQKPFSLPDLAVKVREVLDSK